MQKKILIELIELLESYETTQGAHSKSNLSDFLVYAQLNSASHIDDMRQIGGDREETLNQSRQDANADPSILITLMYRYAKNYIKKALANSVIQTADEFAFLITLMTHDSLTKTELITTQVMEKTSGIEVIKRLVAQGLIHEFADTQDKRSVRVQVTEKGKIAIYEVLPDMSSVSKLVLGNLNIMETKILSSLLKKLDFFHHDLFMHNRQDTLADLLQKIETS
jgi:DNA-binding MarR family transcriptional regulator